MTARDEHVPLVATGSPVATEPMNEETTMSAEHVPAVRYQVRDQVAWVTIDNPARANCLTLDMITTLDVIWARAVDDPDVRAVVLTGTGERHFCAGVDRSVLAGELPTWDDGRHNRTAFTQGVDKPVIALVNGAAIGLGMNLALDADLVVATRNASFGDPRVELGLLPNAAIVNAHNAPLGEMVRLGVVGEQLTATRAREIGLVVDVADTLDEARSIVERYARAVVARPPHIVRASIGFIRSASRGGPFQQLMADVDVVTQAFEDTITAANRVRVGAGPSTADRGA
ncbi:MAG: hypothetical protein ABS81_09500 [Pseudonocardia sp. SCN 72-86]|nr:MAG: hypothetical protein ABS81_09500 [Pseudonocardia sp. SCN 72-86]